MRSRLGPIPTSACLVLALAIAACTTDAPPASSGPATTISQPEPPEDLPVAPASDRVDLAMPTFSNPTEITNPLFPVSSQHSVLLLGTVEDAAFRTEVTPLPATRIVEWEGQRVETLVSQYVAFLDGQIEEVAYDLYAQADDGSVWYFGEDVFNFADGAIADTHGTWMAGVDGPPAMIMPANPAVGDVYRPENIPGLVFEEVTVISTDETLEGPLGPIEGGLLVEELHMDGATEQKTFAPGYGEFSTAAGGEVEALALAVPTDAADAPVPPELEKMIGTADETAVTVTDEDWPAAMEIVAELDATWQAYRATDVPRLIEPAMNETLDALALAIDDRDAAEAARAAVAAGRLALDLELRHLSPLEIDLARFDLWLAEVGIDAAEGDAARLNADYFALDYTRERFAAHLDPADAAELNLAMEELLGAIGDEDAEAAATIASELRGSLADFAIAD
jgi:hypothetical protein